jgi:hypothetical protein
LPFNIEGEIINQIFQDLDIPDGMKSGILTPILKKGKDKNIPGNYRGIVVTNTFIRDHISPSTPS